MRFKLTYKTKSDLMERVFFYDMDSEEDHLLGELIYTNQSTGRVLVIRRNELDWYLIEAENVN